MNWSLVSVVRKSKDLVWFLDRRDASFLAIVSYMNWNGKWDIELHNPRSCFTEHSTRNSYEEARQLVKRMVGIWKEKTEAIPMRY